LWSHVDCRRMTVPNERDYRALVEAVGSWRVEGQEGP
jgi:hypothetical protein